MEISLRAVIACAAKGESNFMLFIESRIADLSVEKSLRTPLLEALQERGLVPLIRSSRLHFFEQALMSAERVKDLEQAVAEWSDAEGDEPYVRGDVFYFDDIARPAVAAVRVAAICLVAPDENPLAAVEGLEAGTTAQRQ